MLAGISSLSAADTSAAATSWFGVRSRSTPADRRRDAAGPFGGRLFALSAWVRFPSQRSWIAWCTCPESAAIFDLVWHNRSGQKIGTVGEPGVYAHLDISPDDERVAVSRQTQETENRCRWTSGRSSVKPGGGASRVTEDPAFEADPAWSGDGRQLAFNSGRPQARDGLVRSSRRTAAARTSALLDTCAGDRVARLVRWTTNTSSTWTAAICGPCR